MDTGGVLTTQPEVYYVKMFLIVDISWNWIVCYVLGKNHNETHRTTMPAMIFIFIFLKYKTYNNCCIT